MENCRGICNLDGSSWLSIWTNGSWTEPCERDLGINDEFVQRLKAGDADAYEAFVRRFETPLYRYFLASHGDLQLATEQSADCFGDLVESLPKMRGGTDQLRPFVFAVARNVQRRKWRRHARERVQLRSATDHVDHRPPPDEVLETAEETTRLLVAIRSLDEPTRDVFLLRFVEQMTIAEVSVAVGEPIGTIKSRLSRGRQRLAEILKLHEQT
jgi:RNA polymerase sigma-70 factor, ECF subfamily